MIHRLQLRWKRLPYRGWISALVLLSLVAGSLGVVGYRRSRSLVELSQQRTTQALSRGLAIALVDHLVSRDLASLESHLRQAMADSSLALLSVRDAKGHQLVQLQRSSPEQPPHLSFSPPPALPADQHRHRAPLEAGGLIGDLEIRSWSTPTQQLLSQLGQQIALLTVMAVLVVVAVVALLLLWMQWQYKRERDSLQSENRLLATAALVDALTGIANRRGFEQELEHRWQRFQHASTSSLVLCLLDLDGFKEINDTLGHEAGDQLLITVAQRLRCSLRDSDFVARLGGDEFVLLLDQRTDRGSVETALQRLVVAIAEPMVYADTHMRVTASLGCVVIRSNDTSQPSEAELLRCADQAMYAAKRSGKNRWRLVRLGLSESDPQPDPQQILEQQSV